MGDDFAAAGDEAKMYGIGYVWNPVRWLELYAAYKITVTLGSATAPLAAVRIRDVKIGTIGTRVRF